MKKPFAPKMTPLRIVVLMAGCSFCFDAASAVETASRETQPLLTTNPESNYVLWYRAPAGEWLEALPVGNGRLGAMIFGGVTRELIQLNEETIWSGGGPQPIPTDAYKSLPEIRQLLFDGKYAEAEALVRRKLLIGRGEGNTYQTLGELFLTTDLKGEPTNYRRSLDLDTGVATTVFKVDGVSYRREVFSSAPDQVVVIRLTTDTPGKLSFSAALERTNVQIEASGNDTLVLSRGGRSRNPTGGVNFAAVLKTVADGGRVDARGNRLTISNANAVTLLLACASDYNRKNPLEPLTRDFFAAAQATVKAVSAQSYAQLKERNVADHQGLFRRVDLQLSASPGPDRPTDERLEAVKNGADDPHLVALYFQYGRYLLMGSSRPGDMPANLQGIWNKDIWAPWGADYHININIQMNYWPAEVCNLSECHEPFFDFVEAYAADFRPEGGDEYYGARGFVGHYTTDAWLYTPTGGDPNGRCGRWAAPGARGISSSTTGSPATACSWSSAPIRFFATPVCSCSTGWCRTRRPASSSPARARRRKTSSSRRTARTTALRWANSMDQEDRLGHVQQFPGRGARARDHQRTDRANPGGPGQAGLARDRLGRTADGMGGGIQGTGTGSPAHFAPVRPASGISVHRKTERPNTWPRRARRLITGWPTAAGTPAGAAPGSSTSGRAFMMRTRPTKTCRRCCRNPR